MSGNGHGGPRKGAGRKRGSSPKPHLELPEELDAVRYLQSIYLDTSKDEAIRIDAAKACAPYERPKWAPKSADDTTAMDHLALIEKLHDEAMKAHNANGKA